MQFFETCTRPHPNVCNKLHARADGNGMLAGNQTEVGSSIAQEAINKCTAMLKGRYDAARGGFGGAPKFPRPSEINVLLHSHLLQRGASASGSGEVSSNVHNLPCLSICKHQLNSSIVLTTMA